MKNIDIEIGAIGEQCRVSVDGETLPVRKWVIVAELGEVTRVFLDCVKPGGEPYRLRGRLATLEPGPDPDGDTDRSVGS